MLNQWKKKRGTKYLKQGMALVACLTLLISSTATVMAEEQTDVKQTGNNLQLTTVDMNQDDKQADVIQAGDDLQITAVDMNQVDEQVDAGFSEDDVSLESTVKESVMTEESNVGGIGLDEGLPEVKVSDIPDSNEDNGDETDETVEKKNGIVKEDEVYHYYIDDVMQKWLITAPNGDRYYAGADGALARNKAIRFNDTSIGWLYFGDDCKAKKWLITTPDGDRYYAGADGTLVRNKVIRFNDKSIGWLYFGNDGKAKKWLITTPDGDRYYAGADGTLVRNKIIRFKDKSIGWLYFGNNGKAAKWLIKASNGDRYYAGSDGALVRNKLIKFSDSSLGWLYFGNDAKVQKARIVASGGKYYYATSVDGRIMRTKGWIVLQGKKYYANDGGALLRNTWKQMGSLWYHFGSDCHMDKTSDEDPSNPMRSKAQQYSSNTRYLILVNKEKHVVAVFRGSIWNWTEVDRFVCSVGKPSTPSPTGQFNIPSKYPRSHPYFDSGDARCWYPTRIYAGYLFHSILYDQTPTPSSIYDVRLGVSVSHGCVRLPLDKAKWIYYNIPIGTKVVLY